MAPSDTVELSVHIVHDDKLHVIGFLLPKSTIDRMGEGSFADISWIENLLADKLTKRSCNLLLVENFPLSRFFFASNTGLLSVSTIPGFPVALV